jgi:hypothetical protein
MIAMSVLAFAVMGLLTLVPTASGLIDDSDGHEVARHAAETRIAEIRAAGAAVLQSVDGSTFTVPGLVAIDSGECGLVTVVDGPDGAGGAREVQVSVTWKGSNGEPVRVVLSTLMRQ